MPDNVYLFLGDFGFGIQLGPDSVRRSPRELCLVVCTWCALCARARVCGVHVVCALCVHT